MKSGFLVPAGPIASFICPWSPAPALPPNCLGSLLLLGNTVEVDGSSSFSGKPSLPPVSSGRPPGPGGGAPPPPRGGRAGPGDIASFSGCTGQSPGLKALRRAVGPLSLCPHMAPGAGHWKDASSANGSFIFQSQSLRWVHQNQPVHGEPGRLSRVSIQCRLRS